MLEVGIKEKHEIAFNLIWISKLNAQTERPFAGNALFTGLHSASSMQPYLGN